LIDSLISFILTLLDSVATIEKSFNMMKIIKIRLRN